MKKATILLAITLIFAGTTTAQDIILPTQDDDLEEMSPNQLSQNALITKKIELANTERTASEIEEEGDFTWEYIDTEGESEVLQDGNMIHLEENTWMMEISTGSDDTTAREIYYELNDTDQDGNEITLETATEDIEVSSMTIDIEDEDVIPGKEETLTFNLANGEVDSGNSKVRILDGSEINYRGGTVLQPGEVTLEAPHQANQVYTVQLFVEDDDSNDKAANTFEITTEDTISLENIDLTSQQCTGETLATCYPDSEITVDYETNIEPEKFETDVNYDGHTLKTVDYGAEETLSTEDSFNIELPSAQEISDEGIDVSEAGDMELDIKADAYMDGDSTNEINHFDFIEFEVGIGPIGVYNLGIEEEFTFQLQHPITGEELSEVASTTLQIVDDEDSSFSLNLGNFEKEGGVYQKDVYLDPEEFDTGQHWFEVDATSGVAGDQDSDEESFTIDPLSFTINDNQITGSELQRGKTHEFPYNITQDNEERTFAPEKVDTDNSNITVYREGDIGEDDELIHTEDITDEKLNEWYDENSNHYYPEISFNIGAETGSHYIEIEKTVETETENNQFNFELIEQPEVFDLDENDISYSPESFGNHTETVEIINYEADELTITTEIEDQIEENITVEEDGQIVIDPDTETDAEIELEYTSITEEEGEITFIHQETDTERTLDINVFEPGCFETSETICSKEFENILDDINETEEQNRTLQIVNFDEPTDISRTMTGNLTEIAYFPDTNTTIEGTDEITYTLNPIMRGNFTGDIEIETENGETLSWEIDVTSDIPPQDLSATATDIDLGGVPESGDVETDIEIENIGTQPIEEVNVEIEDYGEVISEPGPIGNEETTEATIELQDIQELPENINIEIVGSADTQTIQSSVSGEVIEDVTGETDDVFEDFRGLESQYTDIPLDIRDDIDDGKDLLDDADLAWEDGEYQEARDNFEEAEDLYTEAEDNLITLEQERQQQDDDDDQQSQQQQQQEDSGSILPLLFGIILILSIVGFVIYSSVELEPGDPLYDVLEE